MDSNSAANNLWGPYIVDFVCLEKRLVIEIDGGQHAEDANYDSNRDAWLREQGFIVLRFWNNDVLKNTDGVMGVIVEKLKGTPYLNPSRKGEGGRRRIGSRQSNVDGRVMIGVLVYDKSQFKCNRSRR
jgi:Protein of unknown function (DUF559)